jgi:hypothetical protein
VPSPLGPPEGTSIHFYHRQGQIAERALGFYLLELEKAKHYRPLEDAAEWAVALGSATCHRCPNHPCTETLIGVVPRLTDRALIEHVPA